MAFNDLQMKVTSEFALQALHAKLAPITDFAHNFRELEDRKGASVVIPTFNLTDAAEFDAANNNYFGGKNEIDGATVSLDKHYVKSLMITDREVAETEVQFNRDGGVAIGDTLGKALYNYVVGLLTDATVTKSETVTLTSKSAFADLFKTVYTNDLDIGQTVLMLTPENFAKLLGYLDANVYGGPDAIQSGRIPGLYGFKSVVCATGLAADWKGALVDANSIGVAMRYLEPMAGAYVNAWKSSDPISGMPVGFREACDLASGQRYLAGEFIAGAKVIRPTGIVSLK
jgi:hypothetical protein